MSRELFGTDGVRGLAGEYPLDANGAERIGRAVGTQFAEPGQTIVIAYDTRESSEQLAEWISNGLCGVGVNVVSAGVIPTPGLAYITKTHPEFVAGVMITASHNTFEYNGVKVFDAQGSKLPDNAEERLNNDIENGVPDRGNGTTTRDESLAQAYEDFLVSSANDLQLAGIRIAVDTANGAASKLAERVFERLGTEVIALADTPDGRNINVACGATNTALLRLTVSSQHCDIGVAVDGDADRLIMIDSQGRECTGDHLLYILANVRQETHVVATVMSNLGFEKALEAKNITLERTGVGDRYVLERLIESGYKLGGEQSGHIIMTDLATTGDGLLSAVQVLCALTESGKTLAAWRDEVTLLPQSLVNFPLADKAKLDSDAVKSYVQAETDKLNGDGRILVRASGTEPLARVMVEAPNAEQLATTMAQHLQELAA